ncbi:hypothetical protein [Thermanaerothrix sp.]|uniref:hypothetical protein n=1 Tax=Thermanaerothrix sp. TaxID=2972675 RepID=UPI002ADD8FDA|nr:hypothetical protein [Thermanaerothrix sp.]
MRCSPVRAGINPRATFTQPYGLTPLPGRFRLPMPAQPPSGGFAVVARGFSPGRGDARANVRLVNSPGVYSPGGGGPPPAPTGMGGLWTSAPDKRRR